MRFKRPGAEEGNGGNAFEENECDEVEMDDVGDFKPGDSLNGRLDNDQDEEDLEVGTPNDRYFESMNADDGSNNNNKSGDDVDDDDVVDNDIGDDDDEAKEGANDNRVHDQNDDSSSSNRNEQKEQQTGGERHQIGNW